MKIFSKNFGIILFVTLSIIGIMHIVTADPIDPGPVDPVPGPVDPPADPVPGPIDPPADPVPGPIDPPADPVPGPIDPPADPVPGPVDPTYVIPDITADPTYVIPDITADPTYVIPDITADPTYEIPDTTAPTSDPTYVIPSITAHPLPDTIPNIPVDPTPNATYPLPDTVPNITVDPTSNITESNMANGSISNNTTTTILPQTAQNGDKESEGSSDEGNYAASLDRSYGEGSSSISTSNVDPFDNIIKYEKRENDIIVDKSTTYVFTTPEFSIYEVTVNSRENFPMVPMRIEHLKSASVYTQEDAPGLVYANENVWIGSKRLNYMSVKFRINNSWMEENSINEEYVVSLLRWNGTTWLAYKITMTGTDDSYTYFESGNMSTPLLRAGTASLSLFAISAFPKKIDASNTGDVMPTVQEEEIIHPDKDEIYIDDTKNLPGFDIVTVMFSTILSIMLIRKIRKNI
jgi:PGF-pre-PGF domain-containing protein